MFTFSDQYLYCISDWKAVEKGMGIIPWDLEAALLQIKSDSISGSGEMISVKIFNKNGFIFSAGVTFTSPMQYRLDYCSDYNAELPVQPPVEVEKIWTFTKTDTAFIITCNNVEMLNYLFADSSNDHCVPKLGGDVVEEIRLYKSHGTASYFYRAGKDINSK